MYTGVAFALYQDNFSLHICSYSRVYIYVRTQLMQHLLRVLFNELAKCIHIHIETRYR